jgi:hypothetical protein
MKLTSQQRNALPSRVFGLPKQRKYPEQDRGHAIAAKGRAGKQYKLGNLSLSQLGQIRAKANHVLSRRVQ